jgi:histidinol phosphatase-like PHP family hydrolase
MATNPPAYQYDYHVHTHYSACGKEDAIPAAILQRAQECGLKEIGFTDHCWSDPDLAFVERLRGDLQTAGYGDWHAATSPQAPLRYYLGVEAQMNAPDKPTISAAGASQLDFVLMAPNHYHLEVVQNPHECTPQAFALYSLAMFEGAIAIGYVDVIAHPFTPLGQRPFTHKDLFDAMPEGRLLDCLSLAAKAGVAFELNPATLPRLGDFLRPLYQMCLDQGVRISLGSDSHSLATLCYPAPNCPPASILEELGIVEDRLWRPRLSAAAPNS